MEQMLNDYSFSTVIKKIYAFKYYPRILKNNVISRPRTSVLYILKGKYHYTGKNINFVAESGQAIYLPKGAGYSYEILSDETEVMQVEFLLEEKNSRQTKSITFCEAPTPIKENTYEIKSVFDELLTHFSSDKLKTVLNLYNLIYLCKDSITKKLVDDDLRKIKPAIQYIENHITEKIYLEKLAEITDLSESHLRRLFSKVFGMSPIKYKNSILIKIACKMLLNEKMNVSETADALRFADVYTFSQFFKKEKGISPKKYVAVKLEKA